MSEGGPALLEGGVVLCTVAAARLAVPARDVVRFGDGDEAPWAGRCFGLSAPSGVTKAVMAASGGFSVDTLEVRTGPWAVLPTPAALGRTAGLLAGFLELQGELWPLVDAVALGRAAEGARA